MTTSAPPPIVDRPAELLGAGPNGVRILTGVRSGAPIGAIEYHVAPGFAPPPILHRHTREDAGWFLLEGELEFVFEDGPTERVTAGGSVTHPRNCWFRWSNPHQEPARAICWFSPAGFEQFFEDVAAAADEHFDDGGTIETFMPRLLELRAAYGDEPHPSSAVER